MYFVTYIGVKGKDAVLNWSICQVLTHGQCDVRPMVYLPSHRASTPFSR